MSAGYIHYLTGPGEVACGMAWAAVVRVTEAASLTTCPVCINSSEYRGTVVRTSVIPTDRAILRKIGQVLREYDRGDHTEDEALALIDNLVNKKGPSDGQD